MEKIEAHRQVVGDVGVLLGASLRTGALTLLLYCHTCYGQWSPSTMPFSVESINSPYHEIAPLAHPNETALYFSRTKHPGNANGNKDEGDVWYVARSGAGSWGTPRPIVGAPNNFFGNFPASFARGGSVLYYVYQTTDDPLSKQLAFSRAESQYSWSPPALCVIPYFKNFSEHLAAWVSSDEQVAILSMQGFHTYGHEDLYLSFKQEDGAWLPVENMGSVLNTSHQEVTPFVSRDGKTLFFSSNRGGGQGGFDVYCSSRLDDSWKKWSTPIALGHAINTRGSEHYFRVAPNGKSAYYTSVVSSYGYGDILQVPLARNNIATPSVADAPTETKRSISLTLWDADTKKRIRGKARVFFFSPEKDVVTLPVSSAFEGNLSFTGRLKKIVCRSPDYFYRTITHRHDDTVWHYQVFMRRMVEDKALPLQHVFFEQGSTRIVPGGEVELLDMAYTLVENPEVHVFVEGHTDNRGEFRENLALSQQRVQVIIAYLVTQGVDAKRLSGKGYGSTRPIASNDSEKGREKNRRVSFVLSRTRE